MTTPLRSKGKNTVVWILLALLVLGLGGFGFTNFSGSIRSIGKVGDTEVSVNDYARALSNEINAFSAQVGQQITLDMAMAFGIESAVQSQLFINAALDEQAARIGISAGDDEVRRQILGAASFRGLDGKFDRQNYTLTLRQQGLNETEFEAALRADSARAVLLAAVIGGVKAPDTLAQTLAAWQTETRSLTHAELTAVDLTEALPVPTEAELRAYHTAHPGAFTSAETRDIAYIWLTPAMLRDEAMPDEASLRALYQARIDEYVFAERRLVEMLVYPSEADALAARTRFDAGQTSFAALVAERGLARADVDLGDVAIEDLGAAGDAVFAATVPALLGPLPSDFGPALYAVNAVLGAEEIPFEEAKVLLAAEASMEAARRLIATRAESFADLLAGGATLEDMVRETPMQAGTIRFSADIREGIADYEGFRNAAAAAKPEDFPELAILEDGSIFAFQLTAINPPELISFDEVADAVRAAWELAEIHARLLARAENAVRAVGTGVPLSAQGLVTTSIGALPRGGFLEDVPADITAAAFAMKVGEARVIDAEGRVLVLVLDAVHKPAADDPATQTAREALATQITQSLARDLVDLYGRAALVEAGLRIDAAAIAAVQAQMR
ncbi:SurA N-terminal domain-containing protein [Phaeovulum sp.]|uniref:SurA N-terminal domain-containing protein n=1 Tax=Phaeovulum sp. TaxID=2934796 RepID=UPI0027303284|nr:peptidylprolyl isomerase [Phaeovulum sp.]MDP1670338.1 SurA N-terminal domain-containing protein [Phaeovulum sp.]MDZ4120667.1 SurA N-terminal domain-containing protein [Phaeovulum sp.]